MQWNISIGKCQRSYDKMSILLNVIKAWLLGCLLVAIFAPSQDGIAGSFGYNLGASLRFVLQSIGVM